MRKAMSLPSLNDDLGLRSLIDGLQADILRLNETGDGQLAFGPAKVSRLDYAKCLEFLLDEAKQDPSGERFRKALRESFEPYEVYGRRSWGEVFMTSYYEPVIDGSKKPSARFRQALYGVPKDLVDIDLGAFIRARPALTALNVIATEQRSQSQLLRGRLLKETSKVIPYPARAEIVSTEAPKGQAAELAWVDRIDAFLLEIQGSGIVRFEDGTEIAVGYAAQNGQPYVSIGKYLFDVIPKEKMSIQAIESYLRSVPEAEAQRIMNLNPSFVFFKQQARGGVTFFGSDLVEGRTIATDQTYFPKGALAFLEFDKPVFAGPKELEPVSWQRATRFVLDQDTGGAIRGADRLDLYWGRGEAAKQSAGVMKNLGRLVYFVPKREFLDRLATKK